MNAPSIEGSVSRGYRRHPVSEFRPISPFIVEFVLGRLHYETARWVGGSRGKYQTEGVGADVGVICGKDGLPLLKLPEWRPLEHQLCQWAVSDRCGVRWLDKNRPPTGDCELSVKAASDRLAATIKVEGHRTFYAVDRGEGVPPWTGEKLLAPHLLAVVAEVEEEWDRWWWLQEQRDPEDT